MESGSMEPTDQSRIFHDLTSVLTVISTLAASLRSHLPADQPVDRDSIELALAVERALAIARLGMAHETPRLLEHPGIDLNDFIEKMRPRLTHLLSSRLQLEIRTTGPPGTVRASWDQMEHILLNLIFNASAGTRDGGRIAIETSAAGYLTPEWTRTSRPRLCIRLTVQDTGCGIPAGLQAELAERSFTTKREGNGFGLDTVARTVRRLNGRLQVESQQEIGTIVHVDLPLE
jgi:signal transduction histidine kinase